ncbi:diguanylate cyclase (plasmid) [Azospirillum brasilense]|uniref:Diguanylate cyclase n=1 Tax=Azospirillum brasilense TaxID=192 RepID=A0A4D8R4R3_AZOBR|nr:GGDEF domain-containing protein [Azospirillum brasilense]QCO17657.1 diguanylate cyclase [Azospirillum brasilense]
MLIAATDGLRRQCRSVIIRLMLFGLILVFVGACARIWVLSSFLEGKINNLTSSQQQSTASYVAHDIDEKIKARLDLLRRAAGSLPSAALDDPMVLRDWLKRHQEIAPLFSRGLMVVRLDGRGAIADYPEWRRSPDFDVSDRDWFRAALESREPVIGRPARSSIDGEPMVVMAMAVTGPAGTPIAVLAGATALSSPGFLNLVQGNRIGRSGGFLLVSPRDRLFVSASDHGMILTATPPEGVNPLHDRAMAGYRGTGITVNAAGVEELSAIASVPTAGWFLVARLPTAEAFEGVRDLQTFIATNSLMIAAFAAIVLFFGMRRFFRPLTEAARRMHQMADGHVELSPLPVRRMDEVGELAQGFNYLLGKLREQEAALRASEARMAHMAHHDALTGLPNRTMFHNRLQQAIDRAERGGTPFALLYIDLDGFKPINDTHGHSRGDEVLREVARRLSGLLRKSDLIARIGGDEFAVILEVEVTPAGAETVADKCRAALEAPILIDGLRLPLALSIGVAVYPKDGRDAQQLIVHADQAMYAVKRGAVRVPAL